MLIYPVSCYTVLNYLLHVVNIFRMDTQNFPCNFYRQHCSSSHRSNKNSNAWLDIAIMSTCSPISKPNYTHPARVASFVRTVATAAVAADFVTYGNVRD